MLDDQMTRVDEPRITRMRRAQRAAAVAEYETTLEDLARTERSADILADLVVSGAVARGGAE